MSELSPKHIVFVVYQVDFWGQFIPVSYHVNEQETDHATISEDNLNSWL